MHSDIEVGAAFPDYGVKRHGQRAASDCTKARGGDIASSD
jgi:hypothetical protein